MKIAVVGAGGMGSTYGGRLAAAGQEVWLVDVWAEHVERVRAAGLTVEGPAGTIHSRPRATTSTAEVGPCDLVIVFVKSMYTADAARSLPPLLGPESAVLTLQNGYGNAEILAEAVGLGRMLAGVSYRSAELLGPGRALENGVEAETILGPLAGGENEAARQTVAAFNAAGLVAGLTTDPVGAMWGKLLVNCAGNAVGAITDQDISQVVRNEQTMALVDLIIGEVVRLAEVRGVRLPYADPGQQVRGGWSKLAPGARASTHQDVFKGRATEIEALNGAIVRESEKLGLEAPYNRAVTLLVKSLEVRNQRRLAGVA